jgi:MFS family permease
VLLTAGSLLAALATNMTVMIVARVIQGVSGGVLPLSFGIIRDEFPRDRVTGAVGVIASLSAVGAGVGTVLSGPIVSALDYHWLFWIPMILTAAGAVAAVVFVPESPVRSEGRISWLPAVLLSATLVALLVPLSEASSWGWGSAKVIGLLLASGVLAFAWVLAELRARTPLIDMTMMRRRAVWTNNLVALLIGFGLYATLAFLPQFVETPSGAGYGFTATITEAGLMLLPLTAAIFLVALVAGRLAERVGAKTLVVGGSLIGAVAAAMLAFAHGSEWEIYVATAIMGVGFGLTFASMSGLIVAAVPPEQTGVASGMNANIRVIGGSVGAALMASIVTSQLSGAGLPTESGYSTGFAILGIGLVLAALAGLLIPATVRAVRPTSEHDASHPQLGAVAAGTLVGDDSE